jgi:hypothetical protein
MLTARDIRNVVPTRKPQKYFDQRGLYVYVTPHGTKSWRYVPHDDFNTRVVLFGRDARQARTLADAFSRSPWHNVTCYAGSFESLSKSSQ